jgi:pSer/pThr/pTyr-binding forkhead associated (FHA) protein
MERYSDEAALLVAQTGPLNGQRWFLRKSTLIGRENGCDIVVPDRQVSRHHARLSVLPEGVYLEDLGSKNGTHYNGQKITQPVYLQDGDVIQIALAQKFVFLSSDATVPLEGKDEALYDYKAPNQFDALSAEERRRLLLDKRSRRVLITVTLPDKSQREVEINPPLSVSQFRLLERLYENQGQVVPRQELVVAIWGESQAFEISEQALDALVRRLRERIAQVDPHHEYIITVRGHGLRLENPPLSE